MSGLNQTPKSERLHISIFGKRNSGKSFLTNALCGQDVSLVSDIAGTTTDPVQKAIELHPLGPCLITDTAGFDDIGELGLMRVKRTEEITEKTDLAILLCDGDDLSFEKAWADIFSKKKIPFLAVISKSDIREEISSLTGLVKKELGISPLPVSGKTKDGLEELKNAIIRSMDSDFGAESLCAHLISENDTVLLVMPQDAQAPKGRLILPQVQTIRDLLDNKCVVISTTLHTLDTALSALSSPPKLIITDSQVFPEVYKKKPKESLLTSFSVLLARYKGDIRAFCEGAAAIDSLKDGDRVLIAEACAHNPKDGDIGREKIPALLRKKTGRELKIDVVAGADFNRDLSKYALIIHCGACMFNRRLVLSRINKAKEANVPITNYGIALAHLTGILDKIEK